MHDVALPLQTRLLPIKSLQHICETKATNMAFHFRVGHTDLEGFHCCVRENAIRRYEFSLLHTKARQVKTIRHRRLPPRLDRILPSSGMLRGVRWFETDVSGLPMGLIFKGQVVLHLAQLDP